MKRFASLIVVVAMLFATSPLLAQNYSALVFNSQPEISWTADKKLLIKGESGTYEVSLYGKGFPADTETRMKHDGYYYIQYKTPENNNWKTVTQNMVTKSPTTRQPENVTMRQPDAYVPEFDTGKSVILNRHLPYLQSILNEAQNNPNLQIRLRGLVSDLIIQTQRCYVSKDGTVFSLQPVPGPGTDAVKNTRDPRNPAHSMCQFELARSRAINVNIWLINNGIDPQRIHIYDDPSVSLLKGGNYPNQAVAVWFESCACECEQTCPPCPAPGQIPENRSATPDNGPPQPGEETKTKKMDECWEWAIAGGLGGAGLGWGISQVEINGGQGGGKAGDGGSVSVCSGDNQAACIIGGALFGASTAYISCKIKQGKEAKNK